MDEATKAVIGGWIRHALTIAAGAYGFDFLLDPAISTAVITLVLAAIGFGWSTYKNKLGLK